MSPSLFSGRSAMAAIIFLATAVPIAFLVSLELAKPATHVYYYHSSGGFFRECAKWDADGRRFLVSFFHGGLGQIAVPEDFSSDDKSTVLEEVPVVKDSDLAGNASLGLAVDRSRNRVLVVVADVLGNRYSALAAYDLSSWRRLFLSTLSGPNEEKSFADDVAIDADGNAYITDAKGSKIWKVDVNGKLVNTIKSPLFKPNHWYENLVALNGIVYHPDGYLIAIHTFSGKLYKIDLTDGENYNVKLINVVGGPLRFGDGLEWLSSTKLVVAGNPSGRLVESLDGWETARIVGSFTGLVHRLATAATVKDGRVYLNHIVGFGFPKKKHAIVEAVF